MSTSIYFSRIAAVFLALVLSTVGIAHAITNGEPDGNNHPYVVIIVSGNGTGAEFDPIVRCSGSLIAPTVVLTAGHCTSYYTNARIWIDPGPIDWGTWLDDYVPGENNPCGDHTGFPCDGVEGTTYTHEDFTVGNTEPPYGGIFYRDVGVIVLDEPVSVDRYAVLPLVGVVDTLANKADVDLVGYGVQYQAQIPGNLLGPTPYPPPYQRWEGSLERYYAPAQLIPGQFEWSDDKMRISSNPGGGTGGECYGDSGSPVLLAGSDTVLGVFSYLHYYSCAGNSYATRVDIPDVYYWIIDFLQ